MAIQISDDTICISWDEDPNNEEYWDSTRFTWSDCILIDTALEEISNGALPPPHIPEHPWVRQSLDKLGKSDKKRKCRLIQLITMVKEQRIVEEKEICDMEIKVEDVTLVKNEMEKKMNIKFTN